MTKGRLSLNFIRVNTLGRLVMTLGGSTIPFLITVNTLDRLADHDCWSTFTLFIRVNTLDQLVMTADVELYRVKYNNGITRYIPRIHMVCLSFAYYGFTS